MDEPIMYSYNTGDCLIFRKHKGWYIWDNLIADIVYYGISLIAIFEYIDKRGSI